MLVKLVIVTKRRCEFVLKNVVKEIRILLWCERFDNKFQKSSNKERICESKFRDEISRG
jgi:hypothetical protein